MEEQSTENRSDDRGVSLKYLLLAGVVVILLVGVFLVYYNPPCRETVEESVTENLSVYYLMPPDCGDCDLQMIEDISSELGIKVRAIQTKIVPRPNMLVIYGDRADLGLANSRLNTLSLLCEFADIKRACELRDELRDIESAVECLGRYNLSANTPIFYTDSDCDHCREMSAWVEQLSGEGYAFYKIDIADEGRTRIVDECLSSILDMSGNVPQFACTALGRNHVGAFKSLEDMREFAVNCVSA